MRRMIFFLIFLVLITACTPKESSICNRPYLGFAFYPGAVISDNPERYINSYSRHADLMLFHFGDSVPWEQLKICHSLQPCEKLSKEMQPIAKENHALLSNLAEQAKSFNGKIYLSLSPLNNDRDGVASNTFEENELGMTPPGSDFNNSQVRELYLLYVEEMVRILRPDIVSQGVEINMYVASSPKDAQNLITLMREAKDRVISPVVVIGPSIQWEFWKRDWKDSNGSLSILAKELTSLGGGYAISTYPQLFNTTFGENHYNFASFGLNIPNNVGLYISETGAKSEAQPALLSALLNLNSTYNLKSITWFFFEDADGYFSTVSDEFNIFKNIGLVDDSTISTHNGYSQWIELKDQCEHR